MISVLNFPFTAIVGQPLLKLALILSTINPAVGGVLVSGPRGSAKSTLARSLTGISSSARNNTIPPFVTLPLGATEEMLVGTLNLQDVLKEQKVAFQEGLLAKAHRGVLYVDEVNLLQDNLVDLLLDVSASGTNVIERDGISHSHPARFLLLGSMNPDEGELRPQLHDRFGFSVLLSNEYSLEERVAIVKRREDFDANPQAFIDMYNAEQVALQSRIISAKEVLLSVSCSDDLRRVIATRCQEANVEGLRADIVWYRAALAHAAWQASKEKSIGLTKKVELTLSDIDAVEELVLAHRRQVTPNKPPQKPENKQEPEQHSTSQTEKSPFSRPSNSYRSTSHHESTNSDKTQKNTQGDWGQMQGQQQLSSDISPMLEARLTDHTACKSVSNISDKKAKNGSYRFVAKAVREKSASTKVIASKGRYGEINGRSIDWFNSFIANIAQWPLKQLCYRRAKTGQPTLHMVLLDTSASTLQNKLLADAKASVLAIAKIAYLHREQLTILGFGNQEVKTLLPQTKSPKQLRTWLDTITASGGTPLCDALDTALQLQKKQYRQRPELTIKTYLITDGRTTQNFTHKKLLGEVIVIDTEKTSIKRGKAQSIAQTLRADYIPLFS